MSGTMYLQVLLAGGAGAVARLGVTRALERRLGDAYPFGTTVVNLLGALGAGLILGWTSEPSAPLGLTVVSLGFLGAFTTFSSWIVESVELWRRGRRVVAIGHVLGGLVAGTALAGFAFRVVA